MTKTSRLVLAGGMLALSSLATHAQWDPAPGSWINTPFVFKNSTTEYSDQEIWISFNYGIAEATYNNVTYPQYYGGTEIGSEGALLQYGTYAAYDWQSIKLADLKTNWNDAEQYVLQLSNYNGRFYVNYGSSALTGPPAAGAPVSTKYIVLETTTVGQVNQVVTPPSPATPYIPTTSSNIDLSYVDGVSAGASTTIKALNGSTLPTTTVNPITSSAAIAANVAAYIAPKLTPTQAAQAIEKNGEEIIRVNSGSYAPANTYHTWDAVMQSNDTYNVKSFTSPTNGDLTQYGLNNVWWGQNATAPITGQATNFENMQDYTATATFSAAGVTIVGTGVATAGGGTPAGSFTIFISKDQLNSPQGGYGNNPKYTVTYAGGSYTTEGIQNDLGGTVVGDVLAGMVFGAVGSTVSISQHAADTGLNLYGFVPTSDVLGDITSGEFFYLASLAGAQGKITDWIGEPIAISDEYYDIYAYAIALFSDSYGTAFGDRFQGLYNPDTSWYTSYPPADPLSTEAPPPNMQVVGYVEIDLLDTTAVPEPSTWAMLVVGAGLAVFGMRRRANA